MKSIPLLFSWPLLTLVSILAISCEKPVATGKSTTPPPPPPKTETKPAETEPEPIVDDSGAFDPASKGEEQPVEPEPLPYQSVEPLLDVQKTKDKILITGHFPSFYQEKDMIRILSHNFPEHEVVSELDVGKHVKLVGGWGNRVCTVLVPLFQDTGETSRFRFEKGVVTLEGTTKSPQAKTALHKMTVDVMGDIDVTGFEINLKAAE